MIWKSYHSMKIRVRKKESLVALRKILCSRMMRRMLYSSSIGIESHPFNFRILQMDLYKFGFHPSV
ncbi:hypothetical protein DPH46_03565 [Streptococcus agalactiae]|nr:hypothetical protein DPH46_03565 [Streptococcus agalactiae]